MLTQAQFDHLESMIFHYSDDSTLGLFFFGFVPFSIDQEDIFRNFGVFGPFTGNVQFTLNGLPFVDQAFVLAQLAPAAGDEENPGSLADIEPAAGGTGNSEGGNNSGSNSDVACWGDAAANAGAGSSVTYNFGTGLDETLADAAGCASETF